MGKGTNIEWTDDTDNIIVAKGGGWWCRKVSPACANCYAERLNSNSYFGGNGLAYTGQPPALELRKDIMAGWKRQTRARKHFVVSMTDVFGEWVPPEWSFEMLDAMAGAPRQIFQVLTKRPFVAQLHIKFWLKNTGRDRLPDNIWIGATVEDQQRAEERIPHLLQIPAVRFLSCEPLLSALDLTRWLSLIHQVICGGESGSKARPMHPAWVRGLRDQCTAAGVPFFFKQWGEWRPYGVDPEMIGIHKKGIRLIYADGTEYTGPSNRASRPQGIVAMQKVGKKEAGRELDGREWSEFPQVERRVA